uniref:Uncharacterized protein n=1 Tax=Romanomermis culicivorax TaxID=13658 RepID=A0A915IWY7_ROMCU
MWYWIGNPQSSLTDWMNHIPEHESAFDHHSGTYIWNRFALHPIIFHEDFHMDTPIKEIDLDESDYTANPNSWFHFYSRLLNIIDFQNRYSFPAPIYAYPLPTTATVHTLTAEELLDHPILMHALEPVDEKLLDMPIFDLNIAKFPPSTNAQARPESIVTAVFRAMATQINKFLKLMLGNISTLAPVPIEESTPVQPTTMYTKRNTVTMDQRLTNIPEESTADKSTAMDIMLQEPATVAPPLTPTMDPHIYLATPAVLPGPPMIPTIAAARLSMERLGSCFHDVSLPTTPAWDAVP